MVGAPALPPLGHNMLTGQRHRRNRAYLEDVYHILNAGPEWIPGLYTVTRSKTVRKRSMKVMQVAPSIIIYLNFVSLCFLVVVLAPHANGALSGAVYNMVMVVRWPTAASSVVVVKAETA
jgi:hypothetical protein